MATKQYTKVVWKKVPGFSGWQVSNYGEVRSKWSRWNKSEHRRKLDHWISIKQRKHPSGYWEVWINGKYHFVHRLMLEAFVGPRPAKADTRHLDDNKGNNIICNLAWGSRKENLEDAFSNGRMPSGSRHYLAKLQESDVLEIRRLATLGGILQKELAARFGVDRSIISEIISRKRWRWV